MLRPYSAPEAAKLLPTVARLKNAQKRRARPYKHAGIGCARKRRTLSIPRSRRPRVQRPAGTSLTRRPKSERIRAGAEGARGLVVVVCVDRSEPAVEIIHIISARKAVAYEQASTRTRPVKISSRTRELYEKRDRSLDHADVPQLPPAQWAQGMIGKYYRPLKSQISLSKARRREIAKQGGAARWGKKAED